ncbi:uncharacterized protein MELLADRAFT_114047 [Melampsora larici-populina 98AG31]|uniref:Uncharacterized protein n=1 Tax=Melampsora larici-populina (strain 98AG31 / pathotype 3-4-7) TaxID=747676 RepID=F4SBZ3_MELLP|nr:uncharacterized protein MELLADRAFT_114047 [Melampsora larici-populina 98AG31]EGF97836.1 hypothetical protein MELLADRAFT_114047 [Melampsora larici-populina 98AG31]
MSAPNNIKEFNAQVKRTSERLNGGSTLPADAQATTGNQEENSHPTNTGGDNPGSQSAAPRGKGAKGKKATTSATSTKEQGNNVSAADQITSGSRNGNPEAPESLVEKQIPDSSIGDKTLPGKEAATESSTTKVADALPASTASGNMPEPGEAAQKQPALASLIAPEVIGKQTAGSTALPVVVGQTAQSKFLANTNTILTRINECSPDAIRAWLQSKGYDRVAINPAGAPTAAAKNPSVVDPSNAQTGTNASRATQEESALAARASTTAIKTATKPVTSGNGQSFGRPTPRSQSFSQHQAYTSTPVYDGPGGSNTNFNEGGRFDHRNNRPRNRRGSWHGNQGGRERSPQRRRFGGGGEAWRKEERRDDRRGDDRENGGPAGKAKDRNATTSWI